MRLLIVILSTFISFSIQLTCISGSRGMLKGKIGTRLGIENCILNEAYCEATFSLKTKFFLAGCAIHNTREDVKKCPEKSNVWFTGLIYVECCKTNNCNNRLVNDEWTSQLPGILNATDYEYPDFYPDY